VLHGFKSDKPDFVVIPTTELRQRMESIHGSKGENFHSTEEKQCWETRGLGSEDKLLIANGRYENPVRDFTQYLNEKGWGALIRKLSGQLSSPASSAS